VHEPTFHLAKKAADFGQQAPKSQVCIPREREESKRHEEESIAFYSVRSTKQKQ